MTTPRPEYPRPEFVRKEWLNLNGKWRFDFDDDNKGLARQWERQPELSQGIIVPFAYQAPLSGINSNEPHDIAWYARNFDIPSNWQDQRILLHFGAVDYRAWVWVNGSFVAFHEGGHTPFSTEITQFLKSEENLVVVRVEDLTSDLTQPRGKQYWKRGSESIFYTRTTGIWQTVWLEPVGNSYVENVHCTPDIDAGTVKLETQIAGDQSDSLALAVSIRFGEWIVAERVLPVDAGKSSTSETILLDPPVHLWSPETPSLYTVDLRLMQQDQVLDEVSTYFGMRKVSINAGRIYLNNQPYTMRLVLDQGYHPEGLLTFPSDEDFKRDITLTKQMGFNGVRKHQKVEDPRFLYWADQLGLLVWGEMANAYAYSPDYVQRITHEWQAAVRRDYNHPCIVVWVPMNESWGVPQLSDPHQIAHLESLYHLTRSLDQTRLVVSNDGWEHARTDLLTIHDYESKGSMLLARYANLETAISAQPAKRALYVSGFQYHDEPILLTEFGGVAYQKDQQSGWGYSTARDGQDFLKRFAEIMEAVLASPVLQGYCYTQLTDVEQEINGLLTYDRQPKADPAEIARIQRVDTTQREL